MHYIAGGDEQMPRIGVVEGLNIYVYRETGGQHHRPHFHVEGGGIEASIALDKIEVMEGRLPRNKRRGVLDYASRHHGDLNQCFDMMQRGETPYWIEG